MAALSPEHKALALAHLNDIAPDTFDEGQFGQWKFSTLQREDDRWNLAFSNTGSSDGDVVSFAFAGDAIDARGSVNPAWFEALSAAVLDWESGMGEGGDF